ncbi:unnamed protein product [Merluccius merluccius]
MARNEGLEKLDLGALSSEQQEKLRQFKIKTRIANEKYLRSHPEVDTLMSDFLREVFLKRPADVREFAAEHFNNPDLWETVDLKSQEAVKWNEEK